MVASQMMRGQAPQIFFPTTATASCSELHARMLLVGLYRRAVVSNVYTILQLDCRRCLCRIHVTF